MKKRNEIIIFVLIITALFLVWIFGYRKQNKLQKNIYKNGSYTIAIINEESVAKGGIRHVRSKMLFQNKTLKVRYSSVSQSFYNHHNIGDTIIIKFLPDAPEKSMIIEDKEYKSCYGVPPAGGWKELPKCE
jgi:rRNA maturation protein Rpf1